MTKYTRSRPSSGWNGWKRNCENIASSGGRNILDSWSLLCLFTNAFPAT